MGGGSRTRILLVLGLLLALLGGAWWLLRGAVPSSEDSAASGTESNAAASPPQAELPAAAEPDPAGLDREAAAGAPETPLARSPADGFLVKVVDEATRTPIAGAEVMWLYPEQWLHERGHDGLHFGWARASAPRVLTGADGFAVLPHITGAVWIGACTAEASRCFFYYPGQLELPLTIALRPELQQAVRVVDPAGRAVAGACVGFLREKIVLVTATTDADGMAVLRDLQAVRSTGKQPPAYFLALVGPTGSAQRIAFDYDAPPATPPVLQLALGGEVEILLQDARGQPLTGVWPVQLRVDDPQRAGWSGTEENADALTLPARDGRVLFTHVALEQPLQAALRRGDEERAVYARFAGPRSAGERVTAVIQVKEDAPWIALRVLGPSGEPLPGLRLLAEFAMEHGSGNGRTSWGAVGRALDADSRLTFEALGDERVNTVDRTFRRLVELSATDPRSGDSWSAMRELSAPLAPGLNELGEVRLEKTPLVVEGSVRRSDGQPLGERPSMQIQLRDAGGAWTSTERRLATSWQGPRFRIVGRVPPGELRIQAWLSSGSRAEVPFEIGATGVEIVLDPSVPLTGTIRLDPDIPPRAVALEFKNEAFLRQASTDNGVWSLSGLPDGIYTMSFLEFWSNRSLWSVENLAVTNGKPADPSVLEVDLRGRIRPIKIEVVDPEGMAIEKWQIRLLGDDQTYWRDPPRGYGDRILSSGAPLNFDIRADRFAPVEVRGVVADQRIMLPRGIAVRVAILSPTPLPDDLEYSVGLHDEANQMGGESYLDAAGTAEVWVPVAGTYRLEVRARGRHGDRGETSGLRLDPETRARRDVVVPAEGLAGVVPIGLHLENLEEVRKRYNP